MKLILKSILKRFFSAFGYQIVKKSVFYFVPLKPAIPNPTIDLLALLVDGIYPAEELPGIVQIGANDGISRDPVRQILTKRKLPALLVEPLPHVHEQLRVNYQSMSNVQTQMCAISLKRGDISLYKCKDEGLEGAQEWASVKKEHLLKHGLLDEQIEKISVPSMSLSDLLSQSNVPCDILQIDVEGLDDEIVYMGLLLDPLPSIIHFEHIHLERDRHLKVLSKLKASGYVWTNIGWNTVAINSSVSGVS